MPQAAGGQAGGASPAQFKMVDGVRVRADKNPVKVALQLSRISDSSFNRLSSAKRNGGDSGSAGYARAFARFSGAERLIGATGSKGILDTRKRRVAAVFNSQKVSSVRNRFMANERARWGRLRTADRGKKGGLVFSRVTRKPRKG